MDPTACLKRVIELADEILNYEETSEFSEAERAAHTHDTALTLAEQFLDLHHWMQKGGHLPEQWKKR